MTAAPRIGLLDSGLTPDLAGRALARAAFAADGSPLDEAAADPIGHGSAIARLMLAAAPAAVLLDAQIFRTGPVTTAAAAAAGLDWLRAHGCVLVAMSFGLAADRAVLRRACAEADAAGIVLVGAGPARGAPVFPSAYPVIIAVTGDARCAPGEISALHHATAAYGACPRPPPPADPRIGGASFAVGHACGVLAAAMAAGIVTGEATARAHLDAIARYRGRERRVAASP